MSHLTEKDKKIIKEGTFKQQISELLDKTDGEEWIIEAAAYQKSLIFMPDGKTPRCFYCGNAMQNWTPKKGKFKGQVQKHSWVCDCENYPKNRVLSRG